MGRGKEIGERERGRDREKHTAVCGTVTSLVGWRIRDELEWTLPLHHLVSPRKQKRHFNTCILYNLPQILYKFPTSEGGLLGAYVKAETRPRPLAMEQDSLCSSPSGLLSLASRTEFPETLKMGEWGPSAHKHQCTQTGS